MTRSQRGTLIAAVLGSAIVFLDGTLVNIALPRIGEQLPNTILGRLEGQTYVTSGYLATLAAFLVLAASRVCARDPCTLSNAPRVCV